MFLATHDISLFFFLYLAYCVKLATSAIKSYAIYIGSGRLVFPAINLPKDGLCADFRVRDGLDGFHQVLVVVVIDGAGTGLPIELVPGLKLWSELLVAMFVFGRFVAENSRGFGWELMDGA